MLSDLARPRRPERPVAAPRDGGAGRASNRAGRTGPRPSGRSPDRDGNRFGRDTRGTRDARSKEQGHGRRLHGLGSDAGLAARLAALAPERLSDEALPRENFSVQIAPRGLMGPLLEELGERALAARGRAVLARGAESAVWAQNVWTAPFWLEAASIGEAARGLAAVQRNWRAHLDFESGLNRRATLIEKALPHVSARPLVFGEPAPAAPLGSFLLWRRDLVLASAATTSPFADGECRFEENRDEPPGRAYLKLWESFTLLGSKPGPGDLCVELGAAPGAWTWVLAGTGARIFSLDKAPLAGHVERLPNVEHCLGSGFALTPDITGRVDWLFSDMICYPRRLFDLVAHWVAGRAMRRALCTIKFQSTTDHAVVRDFAALPGSQLRHLSCNKHELTWFWEDPDGAG